MKPVDKKDLPKLYVLVALAVCIVGYFVYSMTIGAAPAPAEASGKNRKKDAAVGSAPGTEVASNGPGAVAADGTPAPAGPDQPPVFSPLMYGPPQGGRDPFQPVGPSTSGPTPPPRVANNNTPPTPRLPPMVIPAPTARPEPKKLPASINDLIGPSGNAGSEGPVAPVVTEAPPAPAMAVTGVVLGDPTSGNPRNVAILRGGAGGERRFVSVGDYVGNGYTVVAVHADGVEIQDKAGNRRVTIKLGQPGDNARAN